MLPSPEDASCQVVTLGESLGLFMGPPATALRPGGQATFSFAGAESNVAIGLARLGHRVAFVSRLGNDDIGRRVLQTLRGEGVDVGGVHLDDDAPTSLMVRQHRTADLVTVAYYRGQGAGSRLSPADVDPGVIRRARILHVSGITPALSDTARQAVSHAVTVAADAGVTVSLDVNHRAHLWSSETAGETIRRLLPSVDILFGGDSELLLLEPTATPEDAAATLHSGGIGQVVLKRGAQGASAWQDGCRRDMVAVKVTAVDPVGAGDAFVAGYLSACLDGEAPEERLRRGVVCGGFAVSVHGDWEGAPRRDEIEHLGKPGEVRR